MDDGMVGNSDDKGEHRDGERGDIGTLRSNGSNNESDEKPTSTRADERNVGGGGRGDQKMQGGFSR